MRVLFWIIVVGTLLFPVSRLSATQVIPVNLPHLVSAAGIVFSGRCLDRRVELETSDRFPAGLVVTAYTFFVDRCLKGNCQGETYSFRQWGATTEECIALGRSCPTGFTPYEKGKDYVLFLTPTERLHSPIGLGQGVFEVIAQPAGGKTVRNAFFNDSLFSQIPDQPRMVKVLAAGKVKPGDVKPDIPLDDFMKMVEGLKQP